MATRSNPRKVAILGGGIAALTVAYELTSGAGWKQEFSDITVYQPGWRLGGKGASGRNSNMGERIEERGSHLWAGFYENAFRLLQGCFNELKREGGPAPSGWREAIVPQEHLVLEELVDGEWKPWTFTFPPDQSFPGDAGPPKSPWEYLSLAMISVHGWWKEFGSLPTDNRIAAESALPVEEGPDQVWRWADEWVSHANEFMSHLDAAVETTKKAEPLAATAQAIVEQTHKCLNDYAKRMSASDDRARRLWTMCDLTLTAAKGALKDGVPFEGFEVLDGCDFRDWLKWHGASPATLSSAILTGLYEFLFASTDADPRRQNLAAGVALRALTRLTYDCKGARLWKFPAGMGDGLIAPLYEVLKRRGVRFQFFHRIAALKLNREGTRVEEIRVERQATSRQVYEPLISVKGVPCWPGAPRYELLEEGEELKQRNIDLESVWADWRPVKTTTLRVGKDFDVAVLGISLGGLKNTCAELIAAEPQWRKMVENVASVQTIVSRCWYNIGLKDLGWEQPPPWLTAFAPPMSTWADQSESIASENWDISEPPRCVATLRGMLSDSAKIPSPGPSNFPGEQLERAIEASLSWFTTKAPLLWPSLGGPESRLRWEYLVDPSNGRDGDRFLAQYHRANVDPSDRYVQSLAGTSEFRISPAKAWFGNLFVCGDWTRTLLNVGCVEAAVTSGTQAAKAIRKKTVPRGLKRDW